MVDLVHKYLILELDRTTKSTSTSISVPLETEGYPNGYCPGSKDAIYQKSMTANKKNFIAFLKFVSSEEQTKPFLVHNFQLPRDFQDFFLLPFVMFVCRNQIHSHLYNQKGLTKNNNQNFVKTFFHPLLEFQRFRKKNNFICIKLEFLLKIPAGMQ